ncbi:uncharacterized protein F5Z01DRAFT_654130 [Emericellopsis atlantica]|uniref:Uncharacterized protein n=1 Tax=Emericellopsis atlantica TaxID=2614577 RepID=A0A9P8CPS3_9HYPO|nr:uncharacterized protein F5Z01DRAFT_654130 [Emericellopsis atlantica]KAG9255164.1 hypothetical protein F5Z01DRAFT_654130 [Emericellopsis atlantica]
MMSDNSSTSNLTEESRARARTLANKLLLSQLNSNVTADSAADFLDVLKQQLVSYPALVQNLTTAALSRDTHRRHHSCSSGRVVPELASGKHGSEQLAPEHWEFVRALNTIPARSSLRDWIDYLPTAAIGKHPIEYSLDCLISRWLG